MNTEKRRYSRSKKMAWVIVGLGFILSMTALFKGFGAEASALWLASMAGSTPLYAGKQYQDRKILEIEALKKEKGE